MIENNSLEKNARNFWELMHELYARRDLILESSNRLIEHAHVLDTIDKRLDDYADEEDNMELYINRAKQIVYEESNVLQIFSDVQKELNTIISYANQLYYHINESVIDKINLMSSSLLTYMNLPKNELVSHLGFLVSDIQLFALEVNKIRINPTKKSINSAFAIEVGNEWVKLKTYIESKQSNY
jgi:hypothetical protein